jgi:hypothetical protein
MASETQNPSGLIASSDYKLSTLTIVTSTGDAVDVKPIMLSLDIYEDIFSPCMTGQLVLGDGADIISNYQLHGNEYLLLSVDKPSLNQPITKTFRIYKIANRKMSDTALQNYTIFFCSEELVLTAQMSVSQSYKGVRISDIVNDILTKKLKVNSSKMSGIFESTTGNFDFIIPRMQPLEAIQWLAPRAYNSNENLFLFFENRDGFNFTSYENLLKVPPYAQYSRNVKVDQDPAKNIFGYNDLKVIYDFDIIKSLRFGAYATTLVTVDTISRKQTAMSFGYGNVRKTGLLNGNIPDSGLQNRFGKKLQDATSSMIKVVSSYDSDPTQNPRNDMNWLPQQIARLGQIHNFKILMSIPGDVLVKAGRVVTIAMPKMVPQQKNIEIDNIRTGNYLISAVHHSFQQDIMATVCECISDSIGVPLRSAQNNDTALQSIVKK